MTIPTNTQHPSGRPEGRMATNTQVSRAFSALRINGQAIPIESWGDSGPPPPPPVLIRQDALLEQGQPGQSQQWMQFIQDNDDYYTDDDDTPEL